MALYHKKKIQRQGKCRRTDIFLLHLCARRTNGLLSAGEAGLLSHRLFWLTFWPVIIVDPEYAHLLFHWTRLLWLHEFPDLELIVAHCSRSAQGRVHFITTMLRLIL